jgi:hypothetical protein
MYWTVYEGVPNTILDICDLKHIFQTKAPGSPENLLNPPWPQGVWQMAASGKDTCTYTNKGDGPGFFICPGMKLEINCQGKMDPNNKLECGGESSIDHYMEIVRCTW